MKRKSEKNEPMRVSEHFGCRRLDFEVEGRPGLVIVPTRDHPAGHRPWIFYGPIITANLAKILSDHDWLFRQFLDHGLAVAGVDVGESSGSPAGRTVYTAFYRTVVETLGLSPKPCLLPQSRGGLMLYNWAAENPDSVRCIGGIYTVCDLRSFPGLAKASEAYGMTPRELDEHLSEHNPIDRLAPLARARIPILHVHGDVDTTVPLAENPGELATRYRALGGDARIVVIHGKGHEICREFMECPELLSFFLARSDAPDPD